MPRLAVDSARVSPVIALNALPREVASGLRPVSCRAREPLDVVLLDPGDPDICDQGEPRTPLEAGRGQ